ncbi:MAG: biotin/lipoyl-binding protein [Zoogloea sp.]|nr:biotin/lipoyl-binding protein [Zoogloea sp.]
MPKFPLLRKTVLPVAITLAVLAAALFAGRSLWHRYMDGPWTRDGRVRADVVTVAADVSGLVVDVRVADNQFVHRGDLLFRIDPERFRQALAQADAQVAMRKADLEIKHRQASRRAELDDQVIARETREDAGLEEAAARSRYEEALAQREVAKLNLARTEGRCQLPGGKEAAWAAGGNEPGWNMQAGSERVLIQRLGKADVRLPSGEFKREGEVVSYAAAKDGNTLALRFEHKLCLDTMAEAAFGWTAVVTLNGQAYKGCAWQR